MLVVFLSLTRRGYALQEHSVGVTEGVIIGEPQFLS
jgi:hypothetical protein